jgi:hypothetical protein
MTLLPDEGAPVRQEAKGKTVIEADTLPLYEVVIDGFTETAYRRIELYTGYT